jgi:hypothetical protein
MKPPALPGVISLVASAMCASSQTPIPNHVVRIGAIAGESGVFASLNRLITMYSDGTIRAQFGVESKWQAIDHTGSVSFEVKEVNLRRSQDNVPLAVAHEFDLCDPLNQIDLSTTVDKNLALLLPKGSRIKAVEDTGHGLTLVIFATNDERVRYETRLALIESGQGHTYSTVGKSTVSTVGNYCGMRSLGDEYRAILIDEPAGSSDFSAAYIYALKP